MTKEEFKTRVSELVYTDSWEDFLESMWDLCNEVNGKDLTVRGFVEKKFDELQEELNKIKKRISEFEKSKQSSPPYPIFPGNFPCDGTNCTNPFQDCINCPRMFGKGQCGWYTTSISNCPGRKKCD